MGGGRFSIALLAAAILAALTSLGDAVYAQELTPRAYWPAPVGTRVAVFGYAYTSGDSLLDPSIPLYGVDSKLHHGVLGYLQTFDLAGRTANIVLELPYSWAETSGAVVTTPVSRSYSGFSDASATLSFNLIGAPAMDREAFQALRAKPRAMLGASVKVVAPTGSYDKDRLLNPGSNRWAIKPEIGGMIPLTPKLHLEAELGVWLFEDNDDFLTGKREQDPIVGIELHLIRRFRPGFWASLDANYFTGGRQTIGGNRLRDVQRNSRLGFTAVVPVAAGHAIKFGFATGVLTEYGTDFDQYLLAYQVLF
ncbi:MAG: transporter [Planctomycetes bacterium]|nr:transporter [Planctomycetota bacterium]